MLWRLTGDKDIEAYWKAFLEENPSMRDDFNTAVRDFSMIKLNNDSLTDTEFARLKARIYASVGCIRVKKRKPIRRLLPYAACIILVMVFSLSYFSKTRMEKTGLLTKNIIVGENLDEKDIYLITDNRTASFSRDVLMQVDESGNATVREARGDKTTVLEVEKTKRIKLVVPYGKRSQLELSDGTKVWLNSGSVLEFPSSFTGKTRSLNLIGEIYVEVTKDTKRPFMVHTPDFAVKVHGTKFNVTSYLSNEPKSIVLVEGQVSVQTASGNEDFLVPNDRLVCQNNQWDKRTVDVTEFVSWKDGYILLDHTPVDVVLKKMERYYNLSFNIQSDINLATKTCTGKIFLSDNLDDVMETISLLSSTKYVRENKMIYIYITP
jgi:hypothetical protein